MTIADGLVLAFSVVGLTIVFSFALTSVFIMFRRADKRNSPDSDADKTC